MNFLKRILFVFSFIILNLTNIFAQAENDIQIQFENNEISLNEDLVINLIIQTKTNQNFSFDYKFPEINSFQKIGVARKREIIENEDEIVYNFTLSQHYEAKNIGEFKIPALEFMINGISVKSEAQTITVKKSEEEEKDNTDIIEEKIGEDGPILMLRTTNYQPYIGEGFTLKFALYIPKGYSKPLNFYRNDIQLPIQIQKIQINNCWQENFGIEEVRVSDILIGNKEYKEYCFFQSTYYPLDTKKIRIPSLKLSLVKSIIQEGEENELNSVEFITNPLVISPQVLPNELPNNKYPVGRFELRENITKDTSKTSEEINLQIDLIGNGNTLNWKSDQIESDYFLTIQSKSKETSVFSTNREMLGRYRTNYTIIPQRPGKYNLGDYFYWVYFNTSTGKIDTLKSKKIIQIIGSSADSVLSSKNESSEIYQGIEKINSGELDLNNWSDWKKLGNLILIISLIGLIFLFFRSKK